VKYSEFIRQQMIELSKEPNTIFIGYNMKYGSRAYGTMVGVDPSCIYEMPTAEALMTGMAIGMALTGFVPVLFFERHDFMLLASDQIINHLSKIKKLSHGDFNPKVIIRAVIGHDKPFDPGPQHLGDYTELFRDHMRVYDVLPCTLEASYEQALHHDGPVMIVEHRADYNEEV
jgi:acetoin:2,6-dichlorophenolindophenol oxidoreductase subunit beta